MATPVLMPRLGNTVESCLIMKWRKQKGDHVSKGEIICELETDKATFELEAPGSGIMLDVFFEEGAEVPVLTNIAVIGSKGENYDEYRPGQGTAKSAEEKTEPAKEKTVRTEAPVEGKRAISPRAKNRAKKDGIDLDRITGTGPGGRVIEKDVIEYSKKQSLFTPAAKAASGGEPVLTKSGTGIGGRITAADVQKEKKEASQEKTTGTIREVPIAGIRKIIAERMLNSIQNSAQLSLNSRADARNLLKIRKKFKNAADNPELNSITINDLIHFAVVRTLKSDPDLNCLFLNDKIIYHSNIHLGFAVDTPRGLMVPVIKNSQNYDLPGISSEARRLSKACLDGKINPDELNGATFTVTNLGSFGIEYFTPVLNLPQTAILGVGNINLKPEQGEYGINYVPHIHFSLTIDHRVIDGAVGARFMQQLAEVINNFEFEI